MTTATKTTAAPNTITVSATFPNGKKASWDYSLDTADGAWTHARVLTEEHGAEVKVRRWHSIA
jgi:hypothetical protein